MRKTFYGNFFADIAIGDIKSKKIIPLKNTPTYNLISLVILEKDLAIT